MSLESLLILPITITAFLILLMIIVFIHEYGHFSVARLLGIKVDVFSIGFGKTIFKRTDRKGTEWRIAMLPLGGYVKFFGDLNAASQGTPEVLEEAVESETETAAGPATTQFPKPGQEALSGGMSAADRKVCFHFKPVWARALVVAAGPIANFILAIAIFSALFMWLGRPLVEPLIGGVQAETAAAEAGFEPGDRVLSIDGRRISRFSDISDAVILNSGTSLEFEVERDGKTLLLTATPKRIDATDRYGNPVQKGLLGVSGDSNAYSFKRYGPLAAIKEATQEVGRVLGMTMKFLGRLVLGKEDAKQLGGPIQMAKYAGQSVMSGFDEAGYSTPPSFLTKLKVSLVDFVSLAAVVSISIGFINLLPVPVLDGGHLLYYGYEAAAGKPLGAKAQAVGFRVGIVLLASLMLFVTWNDISNLISLNS